jgi:hypothetical protein
MVQSAQKTLRVPQDAGRRIYHNGNDEIDLIEVFLKALSLVQRYKVLILICIAVGPLLGLFVGWIIQPNFSSTLTLQMKSLEKHELEQVLSAFKETLPERNPALANKLVSIELQKVTDTNVDSDVIEATVNDPLIFSELQRELIVHVESNEFVQRTIKKEKDINDMMLMLEREEAKLNNILEDLTRSKKLYDTEFSVADLQKLKIDIQKEYLDWQHTKENLVNATVIQDFVIPQEATNKNYFKYAAIGLAGSISSACALILCFELIRLSRRRGLVSFSPC